MAMFWEFFTFELKFRFKSISIYIYFLLWFTFSFLCVASESFGLIGNNNGKILLNGPYANIYNDIGISFFYHIPAHTYDVDDMIAASKAGLAYYEKNFSLFQFRQYRIPEFPRYRTFAQSFPNTVPFSEGIGFIGRLEKPTDIDFTYFVTAHELGHQWWPISSSADMSKVRTCSRKHSPNTPR
jgi:hypothetical protein